MKNTVQKTLCILALFVPMHAIANEACDNLKSGLLDDVFGSEANTATFRAGSKYVQNTLCTATWNKPDHEALAAASSQYETKKAMAKMMKQKFELAAPPPPSYTVSLTMLDDEYDSTGDAVASLENAVAELSEGITVTVQGKAHTTQVEFGDWVDGVGDKAIWAPKLSELQVAEGKRRFAVSVTGYAEASQNLAKAVELANRITGLD